MNYSRGVSKKTPLIVLIGTLFGFLSQLRCANASYYWSTAHHDVRNTGRANFVGPADVLRTCDNELVRPSKSKGELYYNTGSISLNNTFLYTGTDLNTIEVFDVETGDQKTLRLSASGADGSIVSPPTVWGITDAKGSFEEERLFVGSIDGYVYALRTKDCKESDVVKSPCFVWKQNIGPVVAPVRVTSINDFEFAPEGILLAASSDIGSDSNGMLWALNVTSGAPIWPEPFKAERTTEVGNKSVTVSYGIHYTTAIDFCLSETVVFIGFGPMVIGLSVASGKHMVEPLDISAVTGGQITEVVQSSITIVEDVDCHSTLIFQTEGNTSTAVWALKLLPDLGGEYEGRLQPLWRCEYVHQDGDPKKPLVDSCVDEVFLATQMKKPTVDFEALAAKKGFSSAEEYIQKTSYHARKHHQSRTSLDVPSNGLIANTFAPPHPVLPLSTPSIMVDSAEMEDRIVISQFAILPDDPAGVVCFFVADGTIAWSFTGNGSVPFGSSRSSPAIDSAGNVYVGSDTVIDAQQRPVLFALNLEGILQWMKPLGQPRDELGFISPIVAEGPRGERRAYIATLDNHLVISEGCPTNNANSDCNGQGTCNCKLSPPVCECDLCYEGSGCLDYSTCNGHGNCIASEGGCVCAGGYKRVNVTECAECPYCLSGNECTVMNTCSGHGTCSNELQQCVCDKGWQDAECSEPIPSPSGCPVPTQKPCPTPTKAPVPSQCPSTNPQPAPANIKEKSSNAGAVVAGIGIPLLLVGFCAFCIVGHRIGYFAGSRFGERLDTVGNAVSNRVTGSSIASRLGRNNTANAAATSAFSTSGGGGYGTTASGSGGRPNAYSQI